MLLTTTSTLQDRRIDEYKGVVSGEAILGANAFNAAAEFPDPVIRAK